MMRKWAIRKVPGDGNCLFHAFAVAYFAHTTKHNLDKKSAANAATLMRMIAVEYQKRYSWGLSENVWYDELPTHTGTARNPGKDKANKKIKYLEELAKNGTYGGANELHALSNAFLLTILVYDGVQLYTERFDPVRILNRQPQLIVPLWYNSINHYNAIVPLDTHKKRNPSKAQEFIKTLQDILAMLTNPSQPTSASGFGTPPNPTAGNPHKQNSQQPASANQNFMPTNASGSGTSPKTTTSPTSAASARVKNNTKMPHVRVTGNTRSGNNLQSNNSKKPKSVPPPGSPQMPNGASQPNANRAKKEQLLRGYGNKLRQVVLYRLYPQVSGVDFDKWYFDPTVSYEEVKWWLETSKTLYEATDALQSDTIRAMLHILGESSSIKTPKPALIEELLRKSSVRHEYKDLLGYLQHARMLQEHYASNTEAIYLGLQNKGVNATGNNINGYQTFMKYAINKTKEHMNNIVTSGYATYAKVNRFDKKIKRFMLTIYSSLKPENIKFYRPDMLNKKMIQMIGKDTLETVVGRLADAQALFNTIGFLKIDMLRTFLIDQGEGNDASLKDKNKSELTSLIAAHVRKYKNAKATVEHLQDIWLDKYPPVDQAIMLLLHPQNTTDGNKNSARQLIRNIVATENTRPSETSLNLVREHARKLLQNAGPRAVSKWLGQAHIISGAFRKYGIKTLKHALGSLQNTNTLNNLTLDQLWGIVLREGAKNIDKVTNLLSKRYANRDANTPMKPKPTNNPSVASGSGVSSPTQPISNLQTALMPLTGALGNTVRLDEQAGPSGSNPQITQMNLTNVLQAHTNTTLRRMLQNERNVSIPSNVTRNQLNSMVANVAKRKQYTTANVKQRLNMTRDATVAEAISKFNVDIVKTMLRNRTNMTASNQANQGALYDAVIKLIEQHDLKTVVGWLNNAKAKRQNPQNTLMITNGSTLGKRRMPSNSESNGESNRASGSGQGSTESMNVNYNAQMNNLVRSMPIINPRNVSQKERNTFKQMLLKITNPERQVVLGKLGKDTRGMRKPDMENLLDGYLTRTGEQKLVELLNLAMQQRKQREKVAKEQSLTTINKARINALPMQGDKSFNNHTLEKAKNYIRGMKMKTLTQALLRNNETQAVPTNLYNAQLRVLALLKKYEFNEWTELIPIRRSQRRKIS